MPIPLLWVGGSALTGFIGGFFTGSTFLKLVKWLTALASIVATAYYFLFKGK